MNDDRIDISPGDKTNPLWRKMMLIWQQQLDAARMHNDRDLDERQTANTRGKIAVLKAWIALDKDEPIVE